MRKLINPLIKILAKEITQLPEDAYGQLGDKIEKFQRELRKLLDKISKIENRKKDGKYPEDYTIKPLDEQIDILAEVAQVSPKQALQYAKEISKKELPEDAEGWFAILSSRGNKKYTSYQDQIKHTHERLSRFRPIFDFDKETSDSELRKYLAALELNQRTKKALGIIEKKQKGPIIIIPAQFGGKLVGLKCNTAHSVLGNNEFGLDLLSIFSMLITHPRRLDNEYINGINNDIICLGNKPHSTGELLELGMQGLLCILSDSEASNYSYPTGFLLDRSIYD